MVYFINSLPFLKRKRITINNNSGSAQTAYQVLVTVAYAAAMQADFDDIRFTYPNKTLIDFWLESKTDSVTANFWVEVDLPNYGATPTGDNYIYMYYGNPSAASASNGTNTFGLFDDFSGDLSKWDTWSFNGAGTVVISSGAMIITPSTTAESGAGASSKLTPITNNFIVEYTRKDLTIGNNISYRGFTFGTGNMVGYAGALYIGAMYNGYNMWIHAYNNIGAYFEWTNGVASGSITMDSFIPNDSNYHNYKVIYQSDGTITFYCDGVLIAHGLDTTFLSDNKKIGFFNGLYNSTTSNSIGYIDLVKSRKYASPEPVVTATGQEEHSRKGGIIIY